MATVSASRAAVTQSIPAGVGGGVLNFHYGVYEISSALSSSDVVEFCRLPKCSVVDGFLRGDDIDTGTETFELDIGHAGNGTDTADPDAFLNSGVITGDAVTGLKPEVQIWYPLNGTLKDGPVALSEVTMCQGVVTAAANAGGTGTLYVGFYYLTD